MFGFYITREFLSNFMQDAQQFYPSIAIREVITVKRSKLIGIVLNV